MTLLERFSNALERKGETKVQSRSDKYVTYTRSAGGFYFLGRSGAVRYGKCASKSFAASDKFKELLLS